MNIYFKIQQIKNKIIINTIKNGWLQKARLFTIKEAIKVIKKIKRNGWKITQIGVIKAKEIRSIL